MTSPTFNIGGIASGLDTNSIISQMMQIERTPLNLTAQRRALFQSRNDAWASISTQLANVRTKVRALDEPSDWSKFVKATSSNDAAVTITAASGADAGNLSFTVDRLAAAHQMSSNTGLASATSLVGAGTLSLTIGGTTHDITTDANTTLAGLAAQIGALGGVSAKALAVDANNVRLTIISDSSGDDNTFTVSSDQVALGGFGITQQGQGAQLTIGSGGGAIQVERSSNTVTDLVAGATLNLKATTAAAVTVSVTRDIDAVVSAFSALVSDMNTALSKIESLTKTAAEGKGPGAALSTDSTARSIKLAVRGALSGIVAGLTGPNQTAASVGVSLDRTGKITFDAAKLRTALESDFDGVRNLFSRSNSATDSRVTVSAATSSAVDGTHTVSLTQAGSQASISGSAYVAPSGDETFEITYGAAVASVTITAGSTITEAAAAVQSALTAAGIIKVTASAEGGSLKLASTIYGSSGGFDVAANPFGLAGAHIGQNVAGTIAGAAASGEGRSLTGSGNLSGLILGIAATPADVAGAGGTLDLGSVTVRSGLAAGFNQLLNSILDTGGSIDRATDRWDAQIKTANGRIEQLEERLERKEQALRKYWASLETAMSRMQTLASQLTAGLASLNRQQ